MRTTFFLRRPRPLLRSVVARVAGMTQRLQVGDPVIMRVAITMMHQFSRVVAALATTQCLRHGAQPLPALSPMVIVAFHVLCAGLRRHGYPAPSALLAAC